LVGTEDHLVMICRVVSINLHHDLRRKNHARHNANFVRGIISRSNRYTNRWYAVMMDLLIGVLVVAVLFFVLDM
jgi:hypothetical protein